MCFAACGTIAVVHTLANTQHHLHFLNADTPLGSFVSKNKLGSPVERGNALLNAEELKLESDTSARDTIAQTACPGRDADLDHHFVSFTRALQTDGKEHIFELDGTKWAPVEHGATSEATFLDDVAQVVRRNFFAFSEGSDKFAMMALVPAV